MIPFKRPPEFIICKVGTFYTLVEEPIYQVFCRELNGTYEPADTETQFGFLNTPGTLKAAHERMTFISAALLEQSHD